MFKKASDSAEEEYQERISEKPLPLRFGIEFLDDALRGIFPDDLVLIGAPSGMGKTQLCCNIALANLQQGKRVHYIALEASKHEIERRLKYQIVMEKFFADPNRPRLDSKINFPDFLLGVFKQELKTYEEQAIEVFKKQFQNLSLLYKQDKFGVSELIQSVSYCADDTDLILIDHVHYFDYDDDNENRAMKEIAKTVRTLALEQQKPIILVAHLRKRDRFNNELTAGLDEFHGSSDLYKIATKVVTMSPGTITESGSFETFFRIPKNRIDGGVTRFLGRELYSSKKGSYEKGKYKIGWANQTRKNGFAELDASLLPSWAKGCAASRNSDSILPKQSRLPETRRGQAFVQKSFKLD